ncbi:hypothetical protein HDU93_006751, partial [Gonapodya sp. JEL0774]
QTLQSIHKIISKQITVEMSDKQPEGTPSVKVDRRTVTQAVRRKRPQPTLSNDTVDPTNVDSNEIVGDPKTAQTAASQVASTSAATSGTSALPKIRKQPPPTLQVNTAQKSTAETPMAKAKRELAKALAKNKSPTTLNVYIEQVRSLSTENTLSHSNTPDQVQNLQSNSAGSLMPLGNILKNKFDPKQHVISMTDSMESLNEIIDTIRRLKPDIQDTDIVSVIIECLPTALRGKFNKNIPPPQHYVDRPSRPVTLDDMLHWVMAHCATPALMRYFENAMVRGNWPVDAEGQPMAAADVLSQLEHWHGVKLRYWTPQYNRAEPSREVLTHAVVSAFLHIIGPTNSAECYRIAELNSRRLETLEDWRVFARTLAPKPDTPMHNARSKGADNTTNGNGNKRQRSDSSQDSDSGSAKRFTPYNSRNGQGTWRANKSNGRSSSTNRAQPRDRETRATETCERCGKGGHSAAKCRTSWKNFKRSKESGSK